MNEYFADYEEEKFEGKTYYKQLRTNQKIRQRFFIKGLDSSLEKLVFSNILVFKTFNLILL